MGKILIYDYLIDDDVQLGRWEASYDSWHLPEGRNPCPPARRMALLALVNDDGPDGAIRRSGGGELFIDFWALFSAVERGFLYGTGWPDCADTAVVSIGAPFSAEA